MRDLLRIGEILGSVAATIDALCVDGISLQRSADGSPSDSFTRTEGVHDDL
jgi:hypothetical protein